MKVGDKIKIPKTKCGEMDYKSTVVEIANNRNQNYLYVCGINNLYENKILLSYSEFGFDVETFYATEVELEERKFVLPTCWYIRVDKENVDILSKWRFEKENIKLPIGYVTGIAKTFLLFTKEHNPEPTPKEEWGMEITTEQFKKYVLNINDMNKKIIGYKAPFDLFDRKVKKGAIYKKQPGFPNSYGVEGQLVDGYSVVKEIVETWEPVYEYDFKIGDWVYFTSIGSNITGCKMGDVKQIKNITLMDCPRQKCIIEYTDWSKSSGRDNCFRLATEEEIEKSKLIIVEMRSLQGNFQIEIKDGKAYYRKENKELPKEWIESIIKSYKSITTYNNFYSPYAITIDNIKIGCMTGIMREDVEKVYELLK